MYLLLRAIISVMIFKNTHLQLHTKPDYLFTGHQLATLILPMIIDLFLVFFVGMIDSIMVSSVGEGAVSAVSLVDQVMQLFLMAFSAMATGGAVVAGQYLGAKKEKEACNSTYQLIWFMFLCGIGFAAILLLFRHLILHLCFGQITKEVFSYANKYMIFTACSLPMLTIHQGGTAVFRAMGNSKGPMWISVMMNLINFAGNASLIYGLGMDTDGAGISTLASRTAAAVVVVILLLNQDRLLHLPKTFAYHPDGSLIKRILYVAIPNGVENGMFQLGKLVLLSLVALYGTSAITANAITNNMASIQLIPGIACNMAVTTVIARCVGYGDIKQIRYYNQLMLKIMFITMEIFAWIVYFLMPFVLTLYHASDQTAHLTMVMFRWHTIGAVALWPTAFEFPQALRSAGDVKFPMVVSLITMWLIRILGAYILAKIFGFGAVAPWIAMVIDFAARFFIFQHRWCRGKWIGKQVI